MSIWALTFVASTALAALGFVVVAIVWLKKLRETLSVMLGETAGQQVRTAQRFGETIARMQQQQQLYEQRLQTLTEANLRMRQDLNHLAGKVEPAENETPPSSGSRLLH